MKQIFITAIIMACVTVVTAQVPNQFNYQAVARNSSGQSIPNANIRLRLTILDGSATGVDVYSEVRQTTTNQLGLFTASIGGSGALSTTGNFATINWSTGKKFIKVEADPLGGSNFILIGNTEMLSVPYALYAVNGKAGAAGPANILNIGTVTTGTPGSPASASITGSSPAQTLNLSLPAGAAGPTGATGPTGPIGLTGAVGPQGIQGVPGPTGPIGPAGSTGPIGPQGIPGKNTLIKTTAEPSGSNCTEGGVKQEYGVDANNNGVLDASEIDPLLTKYICNGLTGSVANAWNLTGNTGTTAANFIGTTDANPFSISTNNVKRLTISPAGNTGIGITTPLAPLHIKNDAEALRMQGFAPYFSFYDNAGNLKSFIKNSNNDLYVGMPASNPTGIMQLALGTGPVITMLPSGNVGIGTTVPDEKLTVQTLNNSYGIFHRGEGGNILGTRMGGTSAGIGTFSNTNMRIFANGNSAMFINSGDGHVGVGIDFPANKLQVGSVGSTGYSGNDFAFGNGTNAVRMFQTSTVSLIASSADIMFWPKEKTGNVGINCNFPPTNKFQIGDVGPAGYNGNDIAFGNGTQATAIAQTNTSSQFASTTDFAFLPKYGTGGRVGINTGTPRAPLDVSYAININSVNGNSGYGYLTYNNANNVTGFSTDDNPVQNVSIIASGRIYAKEFDAYSDARIKTIGSITNSQQDLQTINALAITNYTMKDKVMYGNKAFKKVIAQEVEKVYPQVVSRHTDFIPNVYQLASTVTPAADGFLLTFKIKHSISSSAKKLQVLEENKGMQQYDITAIPSATEVIIRAKDITSNKVFVYGEEVDDFRTVDYEGLTTLNISATQELSKQVKKQQALIELLEKKIVALEAKK